MGESVQHHQKNRGGVGSGFQLGAAMNLISSHALCEYRDTWYGNGMKGTMAIAELALWSLSNAAYKKIELKHIGPSIVKTREEPIWSWLGCLQSGTCFGFI